MKTRQKKCGDCLYYRKATHPGRTCSCANNGIGAYDIAPVCFFPDITKISNSINSFALLSSMFANFTNQQRRILLYLLENSVKVKGSIPFGTKVYYHINDGTYLSDYLGAYVLGYSSDKKLILTGSPDRKSIGSSFLACLSPSSVITYKQFQKVKNSLIKKDKINRIENKKVITALDDYDPPVPKELPKSFEQNMQEQMEMEMSSNRKKRKDTYDHLTRKSVLTY